jgi:nucleoside-diphosphate-sugar epimerase
MTENSLVLTGASGRIGRALRLKWGAGVAGLTVLWSSRNPGQGIDIPWDIGAEPAPALPNGAIFLHLAGQTRGDAAMLAENRRSASAVAEAAQASGARHLFFMSSAAVYQPEPDLIDETRTPEPAGDYGHAKLEAERALREHPRSFGLTILRLGNLAGADALLSSARQGPVMLDPIAGQSGGPERSYIGPVALAAALAALIALTVRGKALPEILNLAQDPALPMADLLTTFGAPWQFGPPRAAAVPRVALSVVRLKNLINLPQASAASVVADLNSLKALWP